MSSFDGTDYVTPFGKAGNVLGQNSHPIPTLGLAGSLALMEQAKQQHIANLIQFAGLQPPADATAARAAYEEAAGLLGLSPHVSEGG